MPRIISVLILALVQGITEFLPVSSSGHLVVLKSLFGLRSAGAGLEVTLHAGTLLSILLYYRKFISSLIRDAFSREKATRKRSLRYILFLALATIPIALAGVFLGEMVTGFFSRPTLSGAMLIITALVLFTTKFLGEGTPGITPLRAGTVGLAQALALMPGISRSGITIAASRIMGIEAEEAARFSFMIAIPAMIGAVIYEFISHPASLEGIYIFGLLISALVGYIALSLLVGVVRRRKLWIFAPYCLLLGLAVVIFL